ncbi:hypothetical protein PUNSTDRAFT_25923, partial [Punctularia strigosozonata HHB-11173 SS5]|uniref:uncharacterized protein n=1 Tax=Punctularia strigosozonata (strain HHB-11173) TaxID=741275 RepID=UPI0004417F06
MTTEQKKVAALQHLKEGGKVLAIGRGNQPASMLLTLLDHVAGHVQGSNTSRKYQRNEIKAMIYHFGPFVAFVTISPVDFKNPVCLYYCGVIIDPFNGSEALPDQNQRLRAIANNPTACARFFHFMVRIFIEVLLRPGSGGGLFGDTDAYYGTVESQGRLTLHLHMLIWVKGNISPQQIRDRLTSKDIAFRDRFVSWLEGFHQAELNTGTSVEVGQRIHRRYSAIDSDINMDGYDGDSMGLSTDPTLSLPTGPPNT